MVTVTFGHNPERNLIVMGFTNTEAGIVDEFDLTTAQAVEVAKRLLDQVIKIDPGYYATVMAAHKKGD